MEKIEYNSVKSRLQHAIRQLGFDSVAEYVEKEELTKSTIYAILKHDRKPNSKTLTILEKTGINTHWLITGEGEPLLKQAAVPSAGVGEVGTALESEAGGGPVVKVEAQSEPAPGFEQRREIAQLLVKLDIDNLFHVRRMIDALIAAKQLK
jgi:hypothetical protein